MIHQFIFAGPKPGMSEKDFQDYWIRVHAVNYAAKIPQIKRYLVNARLALPGESPPLWSGIAEIWLENEAEQLASLQTREFIEGARADEPNWAAFWNTLALDTDTHILLPPHPGYAGRVKLVTLIKRREGMSRDDFRIYSLNAHAALDGRVPGVRRYEQCHVRDSSYVVGEPRFDSIAMLWFDSAEALAAAKGAPEFKRAEEDMDNFAERKYIFPVPVEEHWIIGPQVRK